MRAPVAERGPASSSAPFRDEGCAVAADPRSTPSTNTARMLSRPNDQPIACTLEPAAAPDRLVAWRAILDGARTRTTAADGSLRIELGDAVDLVELTRLVDAERRCCAFFSFAVTVDHRGIALEVRAPRGAAEIVASMFGGPS